MESYIQNAHLNGNPINYIGNKEIGILLIHGFTATTVEVGQLAKHFINKDFSVSAPLLPGHGTTPHDLNTKKYREWIDCVENAFQDLRSRCKKILVGGESMGAVLTLYLAEKHSEIKGIYLFSPALLVEKLRYVRFIKMIQPIRDKNLPEDGLAWQGYSVYPTRAAHQFYKLTKLVKGSLSRVTCPALLFQGKHDTTIDANNIEYISQKISSQIKQLIYLQSSGHVMLLDQELNFIKQKIDAFNADIQIL